MPLSVKKPNVIHEKRQRIMIFRVTCYIFSRFVLTILISWLREIKNNLMRLFLETYMFRNLELSLGYNIMILGHVLSRRWQGNGKKCKKKDQNIRFQPFLGKGVVKIAYTIYHAVFSAEMLWSQTGFNLIVFWSHRKRFETQN